MKRNCLGIDIGKCVCRERKEVYNATKNLACHEHAVLADTTDIGSPTVYLGLIETYRPSYCGFFDSAPNYIINVAGNLLLRERDVVLVYTINVCVLHVHQW